MTSPLPDRNPAAAFRLATFTPRLGRATVAPAPTDDDRRAASYRRKAGLDRSFADRRAAAMSRPRPTTVVRIPE